MDFADANPLASCTAGGNGRTVMMVANQTLPEDVKPIFQIHVQGNHRQDLDQFLVQPTKENWGPTSVIRFSTPAQPNLHEINENFTVKLTARDSSGTVSNNKWDFQYVQHKKKESEGNRSGGCGWQGGHGCNNNGYGADNRGGYRGGYGGGYGGSGQGQRDCMFCGGLLD